MADFPHLAALLPHAGPMRLLERVLAHDALETRCSVAQYLNGGNSFAGSK
jgi:predicted hotdog family 3-hydroxylacyl-ACP dehydratase